jgi:enoyl-CoA hydratase/carnithine racemase
VGRVTEPAATQVRVGLSSGIGHLEIRRPEKKNALTSAMGTELLLGIRRLEDDETCHAIVLSGAGGDLSSGADLGEPRDADALGRPWADEPHAQLLRAIAAARIPVIVAVDGWAIGIAVGAVGAAAYAVAGDWARFSLPEIRSGYLPHGVLPHLVHRVAPEQVAEWSISGGVLTSAQAFEARLVTHTAAGGEALQTALELAATFVAAPREQVTQAMAFLAECRARGGTDRVLAWCDHQMDLMLQAKA